MDAPKILKEFGEYLLKVSPDTKVNLEDLDTEIKHIEDVYFPEVVSILQKSPEFFTVERTLFSTNLSMIWDSVGDEEKGEIWKNLQASLFACFLHGDISEKIGKIIDVVKKVWVSSGQSNDDIDKILNDDESESKLKEILDYVMECRLAKIFMEIVESFDMSDIEINFESPQELIELIKNPENPIVQKLMKRMQGIIEGKMKRGEITQQLIESEIHGIKNKVVGMFGNVFNDFLGGRKADVPAQVLMSNTTEARRQRMLARLQRKLREKNSK